MRLTTLAGYGVVLALAIAFLRLGLQGFGEKGLRLSRGSRLKGRAGRVVGSFLLLIGAIIFAAGGYDFVDRYVAGVNHKKDHDPIEVSGVNPGKVAPPPPAQQDIAKKPIEPVTGGVERWDKWHLSHGWLYLDDGSLRFERKEPSTKPVWRACDVSWGNSDTLKGLHEPNKPFGLHLSAGDEMDLALADISRFQQLQALHLVFGKVSEKGLSTLGSLPLLEWLEIYSTEAAGGDFRKLAQCKKLVYLSLGSTNVSDASLKDLAVLENLKVLRLYSTPISDQGVKELARLRKLEILILGGHKSSPSRVTDASLKAISGLKNLIQLSLHSTGVKDQGLKHLTGLEQLNDLDLTLTGVTDQGLKELAGLRSLRKLSLTGTDITDKGLKELAALDGLEELSLFFTKSTDQGKADLQKALPKLKIN